MILLLSPIKKSIWIFFNMLEFLKVHGLNEVPFSVEKYHAKNDVSC